MPPPTTSTSTALGSLPATGTGAGRRQNALQALAWSLAGLGGLASLTLLTVHTVRKPWDTDFRIYYACAQAGRQLGWSQIYDTPRQQALQAALGPGPYWPLANPPPMVWLAAPFTLLPYLPALLLWTLLLIGCLGAALWLARPALAGERLPWLLAATFCAFPVVFSLLEAQPTALFMLAIVAAWRLAEGRRDFLAGAAFSATLLKPHLTWLVPVVFLIAGRPRLLLGYLAVALPLAAASIATLGSDGLTAWALATRQTADVPDPRLAFPGLLPEPWARLGELAAVLLTVLVAFSLRRRATPARLLAMGLVGSLLAAPHANLQDLAMPIAAGWLLWPELAAARERGLAGAVYAAYFVSPGSTVLVIPLELLWLALGAPALSKPNFVDRLIRSR